MGEPALTGSSIGNKYIGMLNKVFSSGSVLNFTVTSVVEAPISAPYTTTNCLLNRFGRVSRGFVNQVSWTNKSV